MLSLFMLLASGFAVAQKWAQLAPFPEPSEFIGNRLHLVSGNVQAASSGGHVDVDHHHALELP